MKAKESVDKDTSTSRRIDAFGYSNLMHHLGGSSNKHKNTSILVCVRGDSEDKVHLRQSPSILPRRAEDATGHEGKDQTLPVNRPRRPERTCARTKTGGPVKVAAYREICLLTTTMPTNTCVVVLTHDMQSQITMIYCDDTRRLAGIS